MYRRTYKEYRSLGGAKPGPWLERNSVTMSDIHVPIQIVGGTEHTTIPPALLRYFDRQLARADPSP